MHVLMYIRSFGPQYKYLDSKLLAPVVCFAELLYTALMYHLGRATFTVHSISAKISQEGIEYTKAK